MDIKQGERAIMTIKEFVGSNKNKTTYWVDCGNHFDIFPSYCVDELIEKLGNYDIDVDSISAEGYLTKIKLSKI